MAAAGSTPDANTIINLRKLLQIRRVGRVNF